MQGDDETQQGEWEKGGTGEVAQKGSAPARQVGPQWDLPLSVVIQRELQPGIDEKRLVVLGRVVQCRGVVIVKRDCTITVYR